jgi:hypothetical protein
MLLLVAFFVVWPVAGFPWWPLVLVVGLSLLGRLLGFGPLIRSPRGAAVLAGLLVVATVWAWSPWLFVIAAGAALAVVGWWRTPRRRWLAGAGLAVVVVAVAGWSVQAFVSAQREAAEVARAAELGRGSTLPRTPREVMGAVMQLVAEGDSKRACSLFTDPAARQLAAAFAAPDCPAAVQTWRARVDRPDDYELSSYLKGEIAVVSPDGQTASLTACALRWSSFITGPMPAPGPDSPGRMQLRRVAGQGFEITDYRPC